jgi:hypothetical protein
MGAAPITKRGVIQSPRSFDTNLFYLVNAFPQTGRVSDRDGKSADVQRELQDITRCPWHMGDNRGLALSCLAVSGYGDNRHDGILVPRKFSKLLLPTFGGPKIARRIPVRTISPRRLSDNIDCILSLRRCARCRAVLRVSEGRK